MSGLFGKVQTPKVEPPTPLPDEQQQTQARRRRIAKETSASGVKSTILSTGGRETLGG